MQRITGQYDLRFISLFPTRSAGALPFGLAILIVLSSSLFAPQLFAGCGDYVILTGELPDHLKASEPSPSMAHGSFLNHPAGKRLIAHQQAPSPISIPCHGPGCSENKQQMHAPVEPISLRVSPELHLITHASRRFLNPENAFDAVADDQPHAFEFQSRIERPPQTHSI
jgi:hypothetical protein